MPAPARSLSFPSVKSALWSAPSAWYCSSSAGSSIAWARSFGSLPSFQRSPSSTVSTTPGRKLAPAASSQALSSRSSHHLLLTLVLDSAICGLMGVAESSHRYVSRNPLPPAALRAPLVFFHHPFQHVLLPSPIRHYLP